MADQCFTHVDPDIGYILIDDMNVTAQIAMVYLLIICSTSTAGKAVQWDQDHLHTLLRPVQQLRVHTAQTQKVSMWNMWTQILVLLVLQLLRPHKAGQKYKEWGMYASLWKRALSITSFHGLEDEKNKAPRPLISLFSSNPYPWGGGVGTLVFLPKYYMQVIQFEEFKS